MTIFLELEPCKPASSDHPMGKAPSVYVFMYVVVSEMFQ